MKLNEPVEARQILKVLVEIMRIIWLLIISFSVYSLFLELFTEGVALVLYVLFMIVFFLIIVFDIINY